MKKKVIQIIKILGIGLNELIIDIELESITINSIEWSPDDNNVYLHVFDEDDIDLEFNFDELPKNDQSIIFTQLSQITYN